jgi:hypothetical protein
VCFSSAAARAEDSQPGAAPAAPVADAGTNRPAVLKTIKVGGLRSGEAMVLTGRGAERVTPAPAGGEQCANAGAATGG